jgi:pimeloyl-ACP methyl ester carboxylesterase
MNDSISGLEAYPDWWQIFPNERQTITIEAANGHGVEIAYGEAGMGQPLLLLHGVGSWSYNWRSSIADLSEHLRVVCVDAKGYGFSTTSPLPEVSGHQAVELVRIIQALFDQPVSIAAESLGALTALAVAQSHPELVDRLILINVPIFPKQLPNWGMRVLAALPLPLVQWFDDWQILQPFAPIAQFFTAQIRQEVVVDPATITKAELYWLTYPYLYRKRVLTQFTVDLQDAAHEIQAHLKGKPNLISEIQQQLPNTECPTLVMWADCDQWFPVEDGHRLAEMLPNARFQLIPDCGHVASSGNPAVVNAAILGFLTTGIANHSNFMAID